MTEKSTTKKDSKRTLLIILIIALVTLLVNAFETITKWILSKFNHVFVSFIFLFRFLFANFTL